MYSLSVGLEVFKEMNWIQVSCYLMQHFLYGNAKDVESYWLGKYVLQPKKTFYHNAFHMI